MPIYEYVCEKCGKLTDVWQKVNDPPPGQCEACGAVGPLTRRISRTTFVLKGGGWYSDLYGSTKKDSGSRRNEVSTSTSTKSSADSSSSTASSTKEPAPISAASSK